MFKHPLPGKTATLHSFALLSVSLAGLALTGPAGAQTVVSQGSPFLGCTVGATATGVNYPEAEVEPWVVTDPIHPNHLIAAWQQDRWSDGGSHSLMSGASTDGGASWSNALVPGIDACSGGTGDFAFDRASDPWVTFSADGSIAYFMSLAFFNDPPTGGSGANAMLVSRSTDGGVSWGAPTALIYDNDLNAFNDKNSMTADPHINNNAYAVWDRLKNVAGAANNPHGDDAADARARRRSEINRGGTSENSRFAYVGPSYFSRTTDGGLTWEAPKIIHDPGVTAQTIANQVVVLPDANGTVMDFYTNIDHNGGTSIGFVKSTNHGATFGPAQTAQKTNITLRGTVTPDAKQPVRDANILYDVAVDPGNGNLFLVWQSGQAQNVDRVAFSMSTNGGGSWSAPVLIAKTPYSPNKLRTQSFIPSVEVGANHKVYVTYYDFTYDTNNGQESTDYWSITCDIGAAADCRTPGGWGELTRLTAASFDILNAPVAVGHFLGDYQGLTRRAGGMAAVYGIAIGPNNNQIVASPIP